MKTIYATVIILGVFSLCLFFWYSINKTESVNPANVSDMEYYLKQKECTQIMIDQSNGYNVKLPEDCPKY